MDDSGRREEARGLSSPSTPLSLPPVPDVAGTGKWRALTILVGLILAATFFLPWDKLVSGSSREAPVTLLGEVFSHSSFVGWPEIWRSRVLVELAFFLAIAALPHLWGVLMASYSLASLLGLDRVKTVPQAIGVAAGVLVGLAWFIGAILQLVESLSGAGAGGPSILLLVLIGLPVIVAAFGVLYALLAIRRRSWAYLYHGFVGAAVLVFIFAMLHVFLLFTSGPQGAEYVGLTGLTTTTLACCLMLVSRLGEARAVTGLAWRRTLLYLLTLRLHRALPPVGVCPGCAYNLYGLREQRCPECGRPFTFEELGVTPQSLGFSGTCLEEGQQQVAEAEDAFWPVFPAPVGPDQPVPPLKP